MTEAQPPVAVRHLVVVLGDQLDPHAAAWDGFDPAQDHAWMAEVAEEATHVPSAKQRLVLFLSAMRHFAQTLRQRGVPLHYTQLDDPDNTGTLHDELARTLQRLRPQALVLTAPGDWRVLRQLRAAAAAANVPLQLRDDRHFFSTVRDFSAFAKGQRQVRMAHWYARLRRQHGVLMEGDQPAGGRWSFDADNRASFGPKGPPVNRPPTRFEPDATTRDVMTLVDTRFPTHPGQTTPFGWPVTRDQALQALQVFVDERLPLFGTHQDAMWAGEPWLYHAHLSSALNLKLLNPREVVAAAEAAWQRGHAPLAAVEGFIRQILGWREYVRGIYWTQMPEYLGQSALNAQADLPDWYWSGDTPMACLSDAITQTLRTGYAHHIQRLMVTGLYALLLGVRPQAVHAWYLAVYVDAVEWVELPNTLGMALFADGGYMASKPYAASGRYIQRMSNHCKGCRYDPGQSTGPQACPFTTLYWDFLLRHQPLLARNPRMALPLKHLDRLDPEERAAIAQQAQALRAPHGGGATPTPPASPVPAGIPTVTP